MTKINLSVPPLWMGTFCNLLSKNILIKGLKFCHLTPFDWKFLQIGTLRGKDLRKNVSILQEGGLTPVPPTLLVIRVVLLHTLYGSYKGF